MNRYLNIITGAIGVGLMMTFVLGLAKSVSDGFAGFWGGLPLMIIVIFVVILALYDFWEEGINKKD